MPHHEQAAAAARSVIKEGDGGKKQQASLMRQNGEAASVAVFENVDPDGSTVQRRKL
jgi:hypothetical protein